VNEHNLVTTDTLRRISHLAWQHINFYGRYHFDNDILPIDLKALAIDLVDINTSSWKNTAEI